MHLSHERLIERVSSGPLFAGLDRAVSTRLVMQGTIRNCAAGDPILAKGRCTTDIQILASGRAKIVATLNPSHEAVVSIVSPGELVGESGLTRSQPSCVTTIALSDCVLICFSQALLDEFVKSSPEFMQNLLEAMHRRLHETTTLLESKAFLETHHRLARLLRSLAEKYGTDTIDGLLIEHGLSQTTLGQAIGAARETVNKQLREWQSEGILNVRRGSVLIRDASRLEALADIESYAIQ